mmetsp:Transcript_18223/g.44746  ORF Transcript_18223/g.44746 Transcript_18223/m.44746 type:complete len:473 (+) Transcript_18223:192-1610(+)
MRFSLFLTLATLASARPAALRSARSAPGAALRHHIASGADCNTAGRGARVLSAMKRRGLAPVNSGVESIFEMVGAGVLGGAATTTLLKAFGPQQQTPMPSQPSVVAQAPVAEPATGDQVEAAPGSAPITMEEVLECQRNWANAIQTISRTYLNKGDYVAAATKAAGELYGYGNSKVLFKPTKAAEFPFRPTGEEAMSYFVGGDVTGGYKEDAGFAINGGKGWSDVVFNNHEIDLNGNTAVAMGSYTFTCATTGKQSKVEYTFGYKRNDDGKVRIFVHHSSVPYKDEPAPITVEEVKECQDKWANAIKTISATYLSNGDYIKAASDAAAELYGYGNTNVLFKPTKAAEFPFRPTGGEAMSYFVGGDVVEGGYQEDAGFAINGGKGWSDVVFNNHQIDLNGPVAIAMGDYLFTNAQDNSKTRVEYTFGYKRNKDGKPRIFLHHSSVPYKEEATGTTKRWFGKDQKEPVNIFASS